MMRVLIADDEPVALERLELALSCVPEAELVGSARTGRDALSEIVGADAATITAEDWPV